MSDIPDTTYEDALKNESSPDDTFTMYDDFLSKVTSAEWEEFDKRNYEYMLSTYKSPRITRYIPQSQANTEQNTVTTNTFEQDTKPKATSPKTKYKSVTPIKNPYKREKVIPPKPEYKLVTPAKNPYKKPPVTPNIFNKANTSKSMLTETTRAPEEAMTHEVLTCLQKEQLATLSDISKIGIPNDMVHVCTPVHPIWNTTSSPNENKLIQEPALPSDNKVPENTEQTDETSSSITKNRDNLVMPD